MVEPQKFISKSELAELLGVHRNTLMKKINKNIFLLSELDETGYNKLQKLFTPMQMICICRYFVQ